MTDQTGEATWRQFTLWTALLMGLALAIGLALSYSSAYSAAYHAGYSAAWISLGGVQMRPAHLFPLTLDLPLLVGYAGTIALAGRRSRVWAWTVLVACSFATITLQVADGADLIERHTWVKAIIHGWPPALGVLALHLFVLIVQALGFLIPPVHEQRPSWVARAWAWFKRLRADMAAAPSDPTRDTAPAGHVASAKVDTTPDIGQDIQSDTQEDMSTPEVSTPVAPAEATPGVVDMAGRKVSMDTALAKVRKGEWTQKRAADAAGVNVKTIQRRLNPAAKKEAVR